MPEVVTSRGNLARIRRQEDSIMFRTMFDGRARRAIAVGGSTACATKKFVRTSVGQVNDKVDSLGRSVEETQERTRKNEGRDHGSRSEGAGGRRRRPQQAQRRSRPTAQTRGRPTAKSAANTAARRPTRSTRRIEAARVRSRAERGPGQLQVRQGRAAGRSQGEDRRDDRSSSRPTRRAPSSKSKATPTTSATRRTTRSSAWSAPRR